MTIACNPVMLITQLAEKHPLNSLKHKNNVEQKTLTSLLRRSPCSFAREVVEKALPQCRKYDNKTLEILYCTMLHSE